jgi:HEAT repeat protein
MRIANNHIAVQRKSAMARTTVKVAIGIVFFISPTDLRATPKWVTIYRGQLGSLSPEDRREAASALGSLGADACSAIPDLVKALRDYDSSVRHAAAEALLQFGPDAKEAVLGLKEMLREGSADERRVAILALGAIGPDAGSAVPLLEPIVDDDRALIRRYAVEALGNIGEDAVPALIRALGSTDPGVRGSSADSLARLGRLAKPAVRVLARSLGDDDTQVVAAAARALGAIGLGAKPALPDLRRHLANGSVGIRMDAACAILAIDPTDSEAKLVLLDLVKRCPGETAMGCAAALGRIEGETEGAIAVLLAGLRDDAIAVRCAAAAGLAGLGPRASSAAPVLAELASRGPERFRSTAAKALIQIGRNKPEAVQALIHALDTENDHESMIRALGQAEADGRAALDNLSKLLKDRKWSVRRSAANAIKQIDPSATPDIFVNSEQ